MWRSEAETVEFSDAETEKLLSIKDAPKNTFKMTSDDFISLLNSWEFPEELVQKIITLGIQPRIVGDIPNRLKHMLAHALESTY